MVRRLDLSLVPRGVFGTRRMLEGVVGGLTTRWPVARELRGQVGGPVEKGGRHEAGGGAGTVHAKGGIPRDQERD